MGTTRRPQSKYLARKMRQIRECLNLTQAEIIERLDYKYPLTQGTLSNIERGEREAPVPLILSYAKLAKISTDFLIDDSLELPKQFL